MSIFLRSICTVIVVVTMCGSAAFAAPDLSSARQLLVVVTESWDSPRAQMFRFEKKDSAWKRVDGHYVAEVGENGLGWGNDEKGIPSAYPVKREGDRKAPAGAFSLLNAMGYPATPPAGTVFSYRQILESTRCVDDPGAAQYAQIVDAQAFFREGKLPWSSSEVMKRKDDQYKWLLVVDHNMTVTEPGKGSCIFIHVRRPSSSGTAGCTTLGEKEMVELLRWLRPDDSPALVQLPRQLYQEYWRKWNLPHPDMLSVGR